MLTRWSTVFIIFCNRYSSRLRVSKEVPADVCELVEGLLEHSNFHVKTAAVKAAGEMQLEETHSLLEKISLNESDMLLRDLAGTAMHALKLPIPRRI